MSANHPNQTYQPKPAFDPLRALRRASTSPGARAANEVADRINTEDGACWMGDEAPEDEADDLAAYERNGQREPGWLLEASRKKEEARRRMPAGRPGRK